MSIFITLSLHYFFIYKLKYSVKSLNYTMSYKTAFIHLYELNTCLKYIVVPLLRKIVSCQLFHKLPRSLTLRLTPALIYSLLFSCVSMTVAVIGGNFPLDIMCFVFSSGEWESLWFREAERNADQGQHGGPARADSHSPLWAIPPLQAGGDGIQRHRPWQQTLQVKSVSITLNDLEQVLHHNLWQKDL